MSVKKTKQEMAKEIEAVYNLMLLQESIANAHDLRDRDIGWLATHVKACKEKPDKQEQEYLESVLDVIRDYSNTIVADIQEHMRLSHPEILAEKQGAVM